jgi:hypothetical protein
MASSIYRREATMRSPFFAAALIPGLFMLTPVASAETTTEPPTPSSSSSASSSSSESPEPTTTEPSPQPLPVYLQLSAYSGHAGEKVSIAAACGADASPLTSEALKVTEPLAANAEGHQPWALFAETVIRDVRQGSYPVSFHCGGDAVTVHFTVLAREKAVAQVPVVPKGAPQTGDGTLAP